MLPFAIVGGIGVIAGAAITHFFLPSAVTEVKALLTSAHAKLDVIVAAVKKI